MKKCLKCGYQVNDEIEECPLCFNKAFASIINDDVIFQNAVLISKNNEGVSKDASKCIDCGICKETCKKVTGLDFGLDTSFCLTCGQCILTCPTGALKVKSELDKVMNAKKIGKTLICYTAPAVRTSIGEAFGYPEGSFLKGKLVSALRALGFTYVFDVTFGADVTIMEESTELKYRLENNGVLPMITSCCPAWVKYAKKMYPEILPHLSTVKSPIAIEDAIVKNYFLEKVNLKDVFTVAITPCTSKKMEMQRNDGADAVLTITEVTDWLKRENISFKNLEDSEFDNLFGEGSGGGTMFGGTGGVMESALRNLEYYYGKPIIDREVLRGDDYVKDAIVTIGDKRLHVCVIHKLKYAKSIIEDIKQGNSPYDFIEIMNCEGGCSGGGGQPKHLEYRSVVKERRKCLHKRDNDLLIKAPYENPDMKRIYEEFLEYPNSEIAKKYIHTIHRKEG